MYINKLTFFTEWFQMQEEFKTPFEEMSPIQLNKCLQKFYLSARKRDGSYYNKKSLIAIRAALDRHLQSPPFSKPFSIVGDSHFNEANKPLSNSLKTLSKSGQIAPTVHKQALTKEIVEKLYEEGELVDIDSLQPHKYSRRPSSSSVCSSEREVEKTSSCLRNTCLSQGKCQMVKNISK